MAEQGFSHIKCRYKTFVKRLITSSYIYIYKEACGDVAHLGNKIANNAAIIYAHPRPVSVEYSSNPHL